MTKTQSLGFILIAAGAAIVICAIIPWLIDLSSVRQLDDTAVIMTDQELPPSAPALDTYNPPEPTTPMMISKAEPLPSRSIPANEQQKETKTQPESLGWSVISYAEIKALGAYDRTRSEQTFRLSIPSLDIDAAVETVSLIEKRDESGRAFRQWQVPNKYAVGWHDGSAQPGQPGNTVINGHNNIYGAIFKELVDLALGEKIILYTEEKQHIYQVVHREFLPEHGESLRTRLRNARWIAPSDDERLTIVTCWPNTSNSHRLVVIAQPVQS